MFSHTRTQNDKNVFKHGVCIIMFVFRFCYSTTSLVVPFTTVKMSGALTNFCPLSFESEPLNKKVSHFFPSWFIPSIDTVRIDTVRVDTVQRVRVRDRVRVTVTVRVV